MDSGRIKGNVEIIQKILYENTPISDEQFDYFLKINQLKILDGQAKLKYNLNFGDNLPAGEKWIIKAQIKGHLNPKDLEKALVENEVIQKGEEIETDYISNLQDPLCGLSATVKKEKMGLELYFYHKCGKKS